MCHAMSWISQLAKSATSCEVNNDDLYERRFVIQMNHLELMINHQYIVDRMVNLRNKTLPHFMCMLMHQLTY